MSLAAVARVRLSGLNAIPVTELVCPVSGAPEWFAYDREVFIEAEFRTSRLHAGLVTRHIHRPLEAYVSAAVDSGFQVADLLEPMPPAEIEQRYPLPWQYPRFLVLACRRR